MNQSSGEVVMRSQKGQENTPSAAELHAAARRALLAPGFIGLVGLWAGLILAPRHAWAGLLLGNFYFVSLSLGGIVFVALTHIFSAGWAVVFRRVPEAMSAYLPIGAALMFAVFLFGGRQLYDWTQPEVVANSPLLQHKAPYLNTPFFLVRMAVAFGIWIVFGSLLRYHSAQQDADGDLRHTRKNLTNSAIFLLLFTITFIFASIDWLMSLEPRWYSTMFPLYCCAGLLLGSTAAMSLLVIFFRRHGFLTGVSEHHVYELSRITCAVSVFWAYIWFSQFMLIYYTNIPEEAVYFARRLVGAWRLLFLANVALNWLVPMLLLISAAARRSEKWLLTASTVVLVGRWVDLYLLIVPSIQHPSRLGWVEVPIFLGFLPLFVLSVISAFRKSPPMPMRDPYLIESVHFHA